MTIDQIHEMVRGANPVPNLDVLDPIAPPSLQESEGSGAMSTTTEIPQETKEPAPRSQPLLAWVAAAVILILAGIGVVVAVSDGEAPVADTLPSSADAIALVESQLAIETSDVATSMTYFTDDAVFTGGATSAEGLERELTWNAAIGTTHELVECAEGHSSADFVEVTCTILSDSQIQSEIGIEPYDMTVVNHVTTDGIIARRLAIPLNNFRVPENAFRDWLAVAHPEVTEVLTWDAFPPVEQAADLGAQRMAFVDEWFAYLNDNGCSWDSECPVSAAATGISMVNRWAAALTAGDSATAIALLDPSTVDDAMIDAMEFLASYGVATSAEECVTSTNGNTTVVECTLVNDGPIMQALDLTHVPGRLDLTDQGLTVVDLGNRIAALQHFSSYASSYETAAFDSVCNPSTVEGPSWVASGHVQTGECGLLYASLAQDVADWIAAGKPDPAS